MKEGHSEHARHCPLRKLWISRDIAPKITPSKNFYTIYHNHEFLTKNFFLPRIKHLSFSICTISETCKYKLAFLSIVSETNQVGNKLTGFGDDATGWRCAIKQADHRLNSSDLTTSVAVVTTHTHGKMKIWFTKAYNDHLRTTDTKWIDRKWTRKMENFWKKTSWELFTSRQRQGNKIQLLG